MSLRGEGRKKNTPINTEDIMILGGISPSCSSQRFKRPSFFFFFPGKNISDRPTSSFIYESCLLRPVFRALIGISSERFHFGQSQHEAADEEAGEVDRFRLKMTQTEKRQPRGG